MHNLFISYELTSPETNGERVKRACRSLGNSTPLVANNWYVNSQFNADEALRRIGGAFGEGDRLIIANTKTDSVVWLGLGEREAQRIRQNWNMSLKAPESVAAAALQ
ncbi:hypothetical protein D0C16_22860 [Cellvibrio sp. KY-GH-1]|uniref:hypothetical protein n=1 Tax=Cellvibrio sp. KY-GH-1 TaxID=2303332 RepID=UPI001245060B|nr:hypothetical protein [Cellvibrio sp. KY-GH-1]QEY18572.1 hypothetical protein D0C16_22860 [Cellvibrio sp. KY-GH-1]